ncbi:hypothetical protein O181_089498 [Austropuccinia psidii MF-1]|uniref:Uncharacterized protein n=1 Tax=Austropuccinia psidii MF-1 TaxID=1389203 RepID=A0A9Q3P4U7_9BASI|nr:hypothetical protein [Austropuccinia psidii MF-1]
MGSPGESAQPVKALLRVLSSEFNHKVKLWMASPRTQWQRSAKARCETPGGPCLGKAAAKIIELFSQRTAGQRKRKTKDLLMKLFMVPQQASKYRFRYFGAFFNGFSPN